MFVLEYIKKKNFLNKNKKTKLVVETDIAEDEELNLKSFKEEISNEIGVFTLEKDKREDK